MNSLYDKMLELGADMSWYNKSKGKTGAPRVPAVTDDHCGLLSIYLIDPVGKMFTLDSKGEPYMEVRHKVPNPSKKKVYICLHCKKQWPTYKQANGHYNKIKDVTGVEIAE